MPDRQTLPHLIATLTPQREGELRYSAQNTHANAPRLYGGQVLAQVLAAAADTVPEGRRVHSQHAYFLRPGSSSEPVALDVEVARDGGSFSSRRVVARQGERIILVSSLSFQEPEEGDEYFPTMPDLPGPEGLQSERDREIAAGQLNVDFMIVTGTDLDVRLVEPMDWMNPEVREPILCAWMKTSGPVEDDNHRHEALLAYLSDAFMADVCLYPHGGSFLMDMTTASLDHALWLHAPARVDEWLLFVGEAQRVGSSRGLARGRFYNRDGVLVASCAQEALVRRRQA